MPQKFCDIAKKIKDLLKKRYDYDYTFNTINKSKDGLVMSSGFAMENSDKLSGSVKMEYKDETFGAVDVNIKVNGEKEDEDTKLACKLDKLADGLEINLECNVIPEVTVSADYEQDAFAVQAEVQTDAKFEKATLSANGAFTYNDLLSIGVSGALDVTKQEPKDYDLALQYKQSPHIISLATQKKFKQFLLGYHASPQDDLEVGVQVQVTEEETETGSYKPVGTLGCDYMINPTTSLRGKLDTEGVLSYAIQYELSNPALKVNFGHEMKPLSGSLAATNWGFGLTVGDY